METFRIYFTLDILPAGNALVGYIANSEKMKNAVCQIINKILPNVEFEFEEFDCNDICNKIINVKNEYILENIITIYGEYIEEWFINEYNKSDLIKISNEIFPNYIPCKVVAADIIPPSTMSVKIN